MASGRRAAEVTVGIPTRNRAPMLRRAIASVLAQNHGDFVVMVSDNASEDDTAEVVESFGDPRVDFRPLTRDIGRVANVNRLIALAETDFLVLLGDDDELMPGHLAATVAALRRWPSVGVAHTGCTIVDGSGGVLSPQVALLEPREPVSLEGGPRFLERAMSSGWTVCFSSATFRTAAIRSGGGLRASDGVIDDLPLLMRIATRWDFAYVDRPLAVMTVHTDASSSGLGTFTPEGFRTSRQTPDLLYARRREFLATAGVPRRAERKLERIAKRTHRRDRLAHLSMRARTGDGHRAVFRGLLDELRGDPRLLAEPWTLRFVIGQLGGRRLRDVARRRLGRSGCQAPTTHGVGASGALEPDA